MRRIEYGEEPEKMCGAEHRHSGDGKVVMCIVAALDIYSRIIFRSRLNSRKHLHKSKRVRISQNLRHGTYPIQINFYIGAINLLYYRSVPSPGENRFLDIKMQ